MLTLTLLADQLLTSWLWSMTFDWYHLFINLFLMAFLFRGMRYMISYGSAFLFSLSLQIFAFGFLTAIVVGGLYYAMGWEYVAGPASELPIHNYIMRSCMMLGMLYACAQTLFVFGWHFFEPFTRKPYLIVIWMGNFVSAILSYCLILLMSGHLL